MIEVKEKEVLSSDGIHTLRGRVYLPAGKPKGYFHVVHGMTEHIGRYDAFMRSVAEDGYIVFGYDNLGHGFTADEEDLGFIAEKDGWKYLAADVAKFAGSVRSEYEKVYGKLPYYLMGHSMGSFIVRVASVYCIKPDKLIIMGTGGPNLASGAGLAFIKAVKKIKGDRYVSEAVDKLAFSAYGSHFDGDDKNRWLTKDKDVLEKYAADPFCNFKFTVSAMGDLVKLNRVANSERFFEKTGRRGYPVLLVSGADDPVGDYGRGVSAVYRNLKANGAHVMIKLYKNCRHEILNDTCRDEVTRDIKKFLDM